MKYLPLITLLFLMLGCNPSPFEFPCPDDDDTYTTDDDSADDDDSYPWTDDDDSAWPL